MIDRNTEKAGTDRTGSEITNRIQGNTHSRQKTLQDLLKRRNRNRITTAEHQLKKLKRQELLEILVNQSREIDRLKAELKDAREHLEDRQVRIAKSGTLAEASLQIYHIFETAQKAADLYLENVKLAASDGQEPSSAGYRAIETGAEAADVILSDEPGKED